MTTTRTTMTTRRAALTLAALLLALRAAPAAAQERTSTPPGVDALGVQDREMVLLAADLSRRCGEVLERWLARGEVSEERLFSSLYYPMPKTDPPKFTTDWDRLSDRDILPLEEAALTRSPAIIFTVMVDRNGYLPTHDQRYAMPLTGNLASDLVNNRTKRIFDDRTGIAAARSEAPFLLQRYQRDTGETMVDASVPVVVRGRRWGAVRIGYRAVREEHAASRP